MHEDIALRRVMGIMCTQQDKLCGTVLWMMSRKGL